MSNFISFRQVLSSFSGVLLYFVSYFLAPFSALHAQADSLPIGRVVYHHQVNLYLQEERNGLAVLLFNPMRSMYIHTAVPAESQRTAPDDKFVFGRTIGGDPEGWPVYKDHLARKAYAKEHGIGTAEKFVTTDTLGAIAWTLHAERKKFGAYECRRATGVFAGREYEVWYTPDIPISSGPHKLAGLPGLILDARTTDNKVQYRFVALELSPQTPGVIRMPVGRQTGMTYAEYFRARVKHARELEKMLNAESGSTMTIITVPHDTVELVEIEAAEKK
ncbi:MAG: GLPGLI family protein [Saprospiraceae bacterium]|nr:GLPGLI family protein [Saprospiraceae bacterium]MDW8230765.1 GLPGLI family protein [Saprospiraceae bacterium]